jgi:hypothetical protein
MRDITDILDLTAIAAFICTVMFWSAYLSGTLP